MIHVIRHDDLDKAYIIRQKTNLLEQPEKESFDRHETADTLEGDET